MRRTTVTCDCCGNLNAVEVNVFIDREMGPAGSSDDVWDLVDLCPGCLARELMVFLDGKGNVQGHVKVGKSFIDKVKVLR